MRAGGTSGHRHHIGTWTLSSKYGSPGTVTVTHYSSLFTRAKQCQSGKHIEPLHGGTFILHSLLTYTSLAHNLAPYSRRIALLDQEPSRAAMELQQRPQPSVVTPAHLAPSDRFIAGTSELARPRAPSAEPIDRSGSNIRRLVGGQDHRVWRSHRYGRTKGIEGREQ